MSTKELQTLQTRVDYLEQIIGALGLPVSPWVSPANAADILSTSRSTIMSEIERANQARMSLSPTDLIWGKHYRKNGTHWQVNPVELEKVIFLPPEDRPYLLAST